MINALAITTVSVSHWQITHTYDVIVWIGLLITGQSHISSTQIITESKKLKIRLVR